MNNILFREFRLTGVLVSLCAFLILATGCKKMSDVATNSNTAGTRSDAVVSSPGFQAIYLVASDASYGALRVEPNLKNAWGLSAGPSGILWLSAADAGLSFVYDRTGQQVIPPVTIPSHDPGVPGNPTGNIFNPTADFIIPGTGATSKFIFASEDGTVSAWNGGTSAVVVADESQHASYKGLAIANDGGENFLYVTNFKKARIDIFDKAFNRVHGKPFRDDQIPDGYAPFNIREIDGMLYVTYALKTADGEEDSTGLGLGFVDVYWPNGHLSKRFAAHGTLDAPWGITKVHGLFTDLDYIFVGNFGDGKINAFTTNGTYLGQLQDQGHDLVIDGLWALDTQINGISPRQLYFTAGPNDEEDGTFGFITRR